VLSDHEQRVWHEIERRYSAEAAELDRVDRQPVRRRSRGSEGISAVAVGGICIAIMFALVGAPVAGLAVGGATALGWLLWRFWPQLGTACETACLPMIGAGEAGGQGQRPVDDASPGRPQRLPQAD
jgi:hypothetical protein